MRVLRNGSWKRKSFVTAGKTWPVIHLSILNSRRCKCKSDYLKGKWWSYYRSRERDVKGVTDQSSLQIANGWTVPALANGWPLALNPNFLCLWSKWKRRVLQGIIIAERKVLQEKCSAVHHHYFLLECPSVSWVWTWERSNPPNVVLDGG